MFIKIGDTGYCIPEQEYLDKLRVGDQINILLEEKYTVQTEEQLNTDIRQMVDYLFNGGDVPDGMEPKIAIMIKTGEDDYKIVEQVNYYNTKIKKGKDMKKNKAKDNKLLKLIGNGTEPFMDCNGNVLCNGSIWVTSKSNVIAADIFHKTKEHGVLRATNPILLNQFGRMGMDVFAKKGEYLLSFKDASGCILHQVSVSLGMTDISIAKIKGMLNDISKELDAIMENNA